MEGENVTWYWLEISYTYTALRYKPAFTATLFTFRSKGPQFGPWPGAWNIPFRVYYFAHTARAPVM